jgi:CspA family cold shock protein
MAVGTLTWWNPDRGFGFIKPDAGGPDMFLHLSALEEAGIDPTTLRLGQRLAYETSDHKGKPKAADIKLVSASRGRTERERK